MTPKVGIAAHVHRMSREDHIRAAFYHGASLTLENPEYLRALRAFTDELLRQDSAAGDLTVDAMEIDAPGCTVEIRAKETGIAAGIEEAAWIYGNAGLNATPVAEDGAAVVRGDVLLRVIGNARELLPLERVIVNLMQRMGGIATATHKLVAVARDASPNAHVIGTRKTPCGLLDKRAIHHGGGGTHRLSLSDAILIKTNHLRLASGNSPAAFHDILSRAWERRKNTAFFEVEVTSIEEALPVARALSALQSASPQACPCVLMLDNFSPADAARAATALRDAGFYDSVLIEASGNVSEAFVAAFAAAGVDAISIGALTHSARALDLSATLIPGTR
ncbi:MAG TPA: carboxylating nicotinate-nucleotide diphosphorylase [Candidatus Acidoferrales bacterium]|nr:carboxylating nicotinate-nucleotide diphosphorylase [Candidatus Acidoferrales bacterium]